MHAYKHTHDVTLVCGATNKTWRPMETYGDLWRPMETHGDPWRQIHKSTARQLPQTEVRRRWDDWLFASSSFQCRSCTILLHCSLDFDRHAKRRQRLNISKIRESNGACTRRHKNMFMTGCTAVSQEAVST